jgi:hypothetical protein
MCVARFGLIDRSRFGTTDLGVVGPEQVTRCSRGDWTPLELFLASVRRWETGLRRIFVWETDGKRP